MNPSHTLFPMMGRWRLTRAFNEERAISEPAQEGDFFEDGTYILFIESTKGDEVLKLTGKYFFISPDRVWTEMSSGVKGAVQTIKVTGDHAELHANGVTHILKKVADTEFSLPIVDAFPYDPDRKS